MTAEEPIKALEGSERFSAAEVGEIVSQLLKFELAEMISAKLSQACSEVAEMEILHRKDYLTEREVSLMFSVPTNTLRTARSRGLGPRFIKDGRHVLYPKERSHCLL